VTTAAARYNSFSRVPTNDQTLSVILDEVEMASQNYADEEAEREKQKQKAQVSTHDISADLSPVK
jgi:hypothetical protein